MLNTEEFNVKPVKIGSLQEDFFLVTPTDMGTQWNDVNARYRSAIVRGSDGVVVSQGFGKFVNFGEKPEFQPWNPEWPVMARAKLDGSLLIVSLYKDELIVRTRGTVDARQLPNGHEIDILMAKYPKVFSKSNPYLKEWSLLFEWTTPSNIIVLREHDEPTLTMLGAVTNDNAEYMTQANVDMVASLLDVPRPTAYHYQSLEECINDVSAWKGKEGVVIFSPDGQTMKKIKAEAYLMLHRVATGVKGVKNVLDLWLAAPERHAYDYDRFYKYVETTLDFEIAEKISDEMHAIIGAYREFEAAHNEIRRFIDAYKATHDSTASDYRKNFALLVQANYSDWRSGLAFTLFAGKTLEERQLKNAMLTLLENYGN
jgi:hypothetical protein